jgi:hypothetical protein
VLGGSWEKEYGAVMGCGAGGVGHDTMPARHGEYDPGSDSWFSRVRPV